MSESRITLITPCSFIRSIQSQLSAGTGDVVLTPTGASLCYPFGSKVRPIISRADAELICKLNSVASFHANTFGYHLPGHHFIINRQFYEFIFYLESKGYVYEVGKIPKEYMLGSELIHRGYRDLVAMFEDEELDVEQRRSLTMVFTNLIKATLEESLIEPCIPSEPLWRPYPTYGLEVMVDHYYISRKEIDDGVWVYTNLDTWVQFEGGELDQYGIALLITSDTGERLGYSSLNDYSDKLKPTHQPIIGTYNPWSKK